MYQQTLDGADPLITTTDASGRKVELRPAIANPHILMIDNEDGVLCLDEKVALLVADTILIWLKER